MATSSVRKVALITGSTSRIGLGIASVLASKGYDIVLNGCRSPETIQAVVKKCQGRGAERVEYHAADLSKPDQIGETFKFIREKFGHSPDVLVNNAGVQHVAPLQQFSDDKWDQLIAVNLTAAFHTMKLAVPGMKEREPKQSGPMIPDLSLLCNNAASRLMLGGQRSGKKDRLKLSQWTSVVEDVTALYTTLQLKTKSSLS